MGYNSRLKPGKKTREWERTRAKLKPRFEAIGLTHCEFDYEGCWRNNGLSFAHAKKRRNLRPGELEVVALACANCHNLLELMREPQMTQAVMNVIAKRICQPW